MILECFFHSQEDLNNHDFFKCLMSVDLWTLLIHFIMDVVTIYLTILFLRFSNPTVSHFIICYHMQVFIIIHVVALVYYIRGILSPKMFKLAVTVVLTVAL